MICASCLPSLSKNFFTSLGTSLPSSITPFPRKADAKIQPFLLPPNIFIHFFWKYFEDYIHQFIIKHLWQNNILSKTKNRVFWGNNFVDYYYLTVYFYRAFRLRYHQPFHENTYSCSFHENNFLQMFILNHDIQI